MPDLLLGLYFGVLLSMVCYNLFGFVAVGDQSALTYSVYVLCFALFMASLMGLDARYFWTAGGWLHTRGTVLFGSLSIVFAVLFVCQLLQLKQQSSFFYRVLTALVVSALGFTGLGLIFPSERLINYFLIFSILFSVTILLVAASMWRRKALYARIFAVAWVALLVALILNALAYLKVLSPNFLQPYVIMLGSSIEILLLSWVVTLRYSNERSQALRLQENALEQASIKQEKQQKHNDALEQRVDERTFELEMALRELQEVNSELQRVNSEDGLTGLFNRRHFDRQLVAEFRRAWRNQQPLTLIMLDIDYFKPVNDSYGHLVGDQVLVALAHRLKDVIKRPGDSIYRYGGEEFAILLSNTNAQEASVVANRIHASLRATPFETDAGDLFITLSMGISTVTADELSSPEALLKEADSALYAAKQRGRNQQVIASYEQKKPQ